MTPTAFQRLDKHIARDLSPDDWYDLELEGAQYLAGEFQYDDWRSLAEHRRHRSADWVYRCVCSLRGPNVDQAEARSILFEILFHPDHKVAIAVVYTLRRTDWKSIPFPSDPRIPQRLDELAAQGNPTEQELIAKFKRDALPN